MYAIYSFFCRMLGLSAEQYKDIAHHRAARNIAFRGLAVMVASISFFLGVLGFSLGVFELSMLGGLALAAGCAIVLFLLDIYNVQEILATGSVSGAVKATRATVISLMVISSLVMATVPMQNSIDAFLAQERLKTTQTLGASAVYAAELAAARAAVVQATKDVAREKVLLTKINTFNADYATAIADAKDECEGNVARDGIKRVEKCGPKARGFQNEAKRLDAQRTAASAELAGLSGAGSRLVAAQNALTDLNNKIDGQSAVLTKGPAARLGAMFQLMLTNPAALVIIVFTLGLYLLADIYLIRAMSKPDFIQLLADMRSLEDKTATRNMYRRAAAIRDAVPQAMQHSEVSASPSQRRATRHPDSGKSAANSSSERDVA